MFIDIFHVIYDFLIHQLHKKCLYWKNTGAEGMQELTAMDSHIW